MRDYIDGRVTSSTWGPPPPWKQAFEVLYENRLNSRKKREMSYAKNTLYCLDVYNLAKKLDNSVQIVKIYRSRKTEESCPGKAIELSLAECFTSQVG